jgi:hypothetical protein
VPSVQDRVVARLAPWVSDLVDHQRDARVAHAVFRSPVLLDFARHPLPDNDYDGEDHDYLVASFLVTDYPLALLSVPFAVVGLERRDDGSLWYRPDPLLDDDLPPEPVLVTAEAMVPASPSRLRTVRPHRPAPPRAR